MEEIKVEYEPDKSSPLEIVSQIKDFMASLKVEKYISAFCIRVPNATPQIWSTIHADAAKET
jgi:hypothetical protein